MSDFEDFFDLRSQTDHLHCPTLLDPRRHKYAQVHRSLNYPGTLIHSDSAQYFYAAHSRAFEWTLARRRLRKKSDVRTRRSRSPGHGGESLLKSSQEITFLRAWRV